MYKNRIDKYRQYLCGLVLATGGVVWFANTPVGIYKILLSIILVLTCCKYVVGNIPKESKYLLLLILTTIISVLITSKTDKPLTVLELWGMAEYVFYLIIGYNFAKDNLVTNKFVFTVIFIIGIISSLTITNYLFGFPSWTSPVESLRIETLYIEHKITNIESDRLYSTGFGLGRTGWSATLALFIPLCLICINKGYKTKTSKLLLFIIFGSIFVSGSRGGLVAALCTLLVYWIYIQKKTSKFVFYSVLTIFLLSFIGIMYSDFIVEHLRLDSQDITTGRSDQYKFVPAMINEMGFWGLGKNGTSDFLDRYGIIYELHNTFLNHFLNHGWIFGILLVIYVVNIIKLIIKILKGKSDISIKLFSLVIISGFISALFEPNAIYGSRSWYILWWFSLGYILYNAKSLKYQRISKNQF